MAAAEDLIDNIYRIAIYSCCDVNMAKTQSQPSVQAMAELRYQIRLFLRFSEKAARQAGIEPQQHQLLLAIKGLPRSLKPTIGVLAERMQLQPHSTVGLIDRLVERGFLLRLRATDDRRHVLVRLTHDGEQCLQKLARHHLHELQSLGPKFRNVLQSLIEEPTETHHSKKRHPIGVQTKSRTED
jgi:DNA-binding MarR family transcriptional regulator